MAAPIIVAGLAARILAKKYAKKKVKNMHPKSKEGAELDRGIAAFRKDAKKITDQSDRRLAGAGIAGVAALAGVTAIDERRARGFDPEGPGYDYPRARAGGMTPVGGKWGSTVRPSESQMRRHNLPEDSYVILKGAGHESFAATVADENKRGSDVVKRGSRYYSIPRQRNQ